MMYNNTSADRTARHCIAVLPKSYGATKLYRLEDGRILVVESSLLKQMEFTWDSLYEYLAHMECPSAYKAFHCKEWCD